ncbi:hypothetical protein CI610_03582 [invertebrate metagenome]|uniref:Uncharacterized protein n=1 Tax=invertebrate metagenome TaxID=1711999 RepID=A0A2H9T2N5_9ZZZZ
MELVNYWLEFTFIARSKVERVEDFKTFITDRV